MQLNLAVENAGFPNRPRILGLFAAQLEFTYKLEKPIPRQSVSSFCLTFILLHIGTIRRLRPVWL